MGAQMSGRDVRNKDLSKDLFVLCTNLQMVSGFFFYSDCAVSWMMNKST